MRLQSLGMSLQPLNGKTVVVFHFSRARGNRGKVWKRFPHRGDLGIPEINKCLPESAMQVAIICSIKIPLFYECVLRNLNDGQNNSVAQVKLAAFHMLWYF